MRSDVASGSDREAEAGDILEPSAAFGSLVAGEVVLDGDRRAIFRGADGKLRGRGIEPRAVRGDGHHPVTLALGERLTLGD